MSSSIYVVDKEPVFLTFRKYSVAIHACEASGAICEEDSIAYEFANSSKRQKKKVYKAICNFLKSEKAKDPEAFVRDWYNSTCYDEEAQSNLFWLLISTCSYYPWFSLETTSGQSYYDALNNKDYNLEYPLGKEYYICHFANDKSSMSYYINTNALTSFCGNIHCFVLFFSSGKVIKFNHGKLTYYS